jgi:hypothetical protein
MEDLIKSRVDDPDRARRVAQGCRRRHRLAPDGRLNIVASDHPARRVPKSESMATAVGAIIHEGATIEQAAGRMSSQRGRGLNWLRSQLAAK